MAGKKRTFDEAWGSLSDNKDLSYKNNKDSHMHDGGDDNEMIYTYDRPDKVQKAPPLPEPTICTSEFWGQATKDIYMHCADQY